MATKEYLDEERIKLWAEVNSLKQTIAEMREDLDNRTPELESKAKQSSRKASEYRNRSQESKEAADQALASILSTKDDIDTLYSEFESKQDNAINISTYIFEAKNKVDELLERGRELDDLLSNLPAYETQTSQISEFFVKSEETSSKLNVLYNATSKKKKDVDDLHLEIFGYDETNETTGAVSHINGLKDDLRVSFDELDKSVETAKSEIEDLKHETEQGNIQFLQEKSEEIASKIKSWNEEHSAVSTKIRNLLPDALTAGLSHAFEEKRKSEILASEKFNKAFNYSIYGLIAVSLISFIANVYLFTTGKPLDSIIQDLPKMLAATIPLYIPLVWLAYSTNKKSNLSKRLVEEYTHKEVLSKTFEGLSSQIETIEEDNISAELRIKLLYNLLDVSSENPGKLISNYNTSDHPLIDVLETSSRLEDNVKKLEKIPGISKLSKMLNDRAKRLQKEQQENIDDALDMIEK